MRLWWTNLKYNLKLFLWQVVWHLSMQHQFIPWVSSNAIFMLEWQKVSVKWCDKERKKEKVLSSKNGQVQRVERKSSWCLKNLWKDSRKPGELLLKTSLKVKTTSRCLETEYKEFMGILWSLLCITVYNKFSVHQLFNTEMLVHPPPNIWSFCSLPVS